MGSCDTAGCVQSWQACQFIKVKILLIHCLEFHFCLMALFVHVIDRSHFKDIFIDLAGYHGFFPGVDVFWPVSGTFR